MYGNHKYGTLHKRDIQRSRKASAGYWRMSDGEKHTVRVRMVGA